MTLADLFTTAAVNLAGAACRGRSDLFDIPPGRNRKQVAAAIHVCHSCPVLDPCSAWLDSLPSSQRPPGVIAGTYRPPRTLAPTTTRRRTMPDDDTAMTDEQFTLHMLPKNRDWQRLDAWLIQQKRLDPRALHLIYTDAA